MKDIKSIAFAVFVGITTVGFTVAAAQAMPILNVDSGTGKLLGAQNVDVSGTLYDVVFFDGSCTTVFTTSSSGCSGFDFSGDLPTAVLAAQALLDTVLIDGVDGNFDSSPELTFGCTSSGVCNVFVAAQKFPNNEIRGGNAQNGTAIADGAAGQAGFDRDSTSASLTYARFTAVSTVVPNDVPEPSILALLSLGLFGQCFKKRKRFWSTPN